MSGNSDHLQNAQAQFLLDKIALKQRVNAARLERLNGGTMSGVSKDVLDAQVAERKLRQGEDYAVEEKMRVQARELEAVLASQDDEERNMRKYVNEDLRQSWDYAAESKKTREAQEKKANPDFDNDRTGPSSCLVLEGDDIHYQEKQRAKREQMKKWTDDQIYEKKMSSTVEFDNESERAVMVRIAQIREEADEEEKKYSHYVKHTVKDHNQELARVRRERMAADDAERKNAMSGFNALTDEDKNLAMDASGRIIRKDMFKGFTRAQMNTFLMQNQEIIDRNAAKKAESEDMDFEFNLQATAQLRQMEEIAFEESQMKARVHEEYLADLQIQKDDNDRRKKEEAQHRSASNAEFATANGRGFYQGFGKTAR